MKQEMYKALRLIPYGIKFRMNFAMFLLFLIGGTVLEAVLTAAPTDAFSASASNVFNFGGMFVLCAALFPPQMLISAGIGDYALSSPYRRRLQTGMFTKMLLLGVFLTLVWVFLVNGVTCAVKGIPMETQAAQLLMLGIFMGLALVYCGVCYKHFVVSLILLYFVIFGVGFVSGMGVQMKVLPRTMHPLLVFLIDAVLLLLGCAGCRGLTAVFYRHNFSKYAFGAGTKLK